MAHPIRCGRLVVLATGMALLLGLTIGLSLMQDRAAPVSASGNDQTTIGVSSLAVTSTGGGETLDHYYCWNGWFRKK